MNSKKQVKIIVFSQHTETLQSLQTILLHLDPVTFKDQITYCRGNAGQRCGILKRFNSSDPNSPRILLLSLEHNASGADLPIATHVVLVDPVAGSREAAKAMDSQAIARSHRMGQTQTVVVVRFVVKDSIEQEDYEKVFGPITNAEEFSILLENKSKVEELLPPIATTVQEKREQLKKKREEERNKQDNIAKHSEYIKFTIPQIKKLLTDREIITTVKR